MTIDSEKSTEPKIRDRECRNIFLFSKYLHLEKRKKVLFHFVIFLNFASPPPEYSNGTVPFTFIPMSKQNL